LCPAEIVGITGANGKSTTTSLCAHLLSAGIGQEGFGYDNVWLGGNIGNMPLLGILNSISENDLVVLEISSFQLEHLAEIGKAPTVSLMTNLTANHLDRHGTFEAYCAAKENIFKLQQLDEGHPAVSIFNGEDEVSLRWYEKYKEDNRRVCLKYSASDVNDELAEGFKLAGRANLSNLAAAMTVAKHFSVEENRLKEAIASFKSLPHRLEFVAEIKGVKWYNDSIATTAESTIVALDAFSESKILIAGGYNKNLSFNKLGEKIAEKAKAVILIGQTAEMIEKAIKIIPHANVPIKIVSSLDDAVAYADKLSEKGDVVLLSPACASYDMFENFAQRGEIFCSLVRSLA